MLLPLAAIALTAAAPAQDARFDAIWQAEWRWRVAEGLASNGSRKVEPRLPDVSPAAQARRTARWMAVMQQLDAIRPTALSPAAGDVGPGSRLP